MGETGDGGIIFLDLIVSSQIIIANRRLLDTDKHYSLELCFSTEKQPE